MKVKTVEGTITAPAKLIYLTITAFEKAAEYEREKGHLFDHQSLMEIADDLRGGLENGN